MHEPDPQLIAAAKAGDLRAFEHLVRRYQTDVVRLALGIIRDPSAAEDAAQETFVRTFRFLRRYRGDSRFSTWLFSIARNCALDELRRSTKGGRPTDEIGVEAPTHESSAHVGVEIKEAIGALPVELREAILLIDMFGMSYREAATVMGVAEGTVKSRVHRARQTLIVTLSPAAEEQTGEG